MRVEEAAIAEAKQKLSNDFTSTKNFQLFLESTEPQKSWKSEVRASPTRGGQRIE